MKRIFDYYVRFLVFTFCGICLFTAEAQDTFASAKKNGKANLQYKYVVIDGFITNENGMEEGLLVELMNEFESYISDKHGIQINSSYSLVGNSDFNRFLQEVRNGSGSVVGLSSTSIKEERKSFLKFSSPYLNNISVLISHKSVPTLSGMSSISSEFSGLSAYTVDGTTYDKRVNDLIANQFPNLEKKLVPSEGDLVESLLNDTKAFAFVDISIYLESISNRQPIKRHAAGDQEGEQFGIIFPLGSDWGGVMSEFLNSGFLDSPKYRQMVINNLGKGALRMIE